MKKFFRKNKKYLGLILIAAMVFNFVFLPLTVFAASLDPTDWAAEAIGWISGKVLLFASSIISMVLSTIFGVIIGLEAQIIDYIISPANFSFTNIPIVTLGWGITRDLANMFFILILLVIAFATVLKIQSYAIKQLWWKVLVAALLINFSLVIAGFVIDFTQVLTAFFLNQITGGGSFGTITTRLASSMQILNFYNPATPTSVLEGAAQLGASSIAALVGLILTLVGLVITVFVFGAAAIFLIVRILWIWFLLIVAPVAWMLWILPATSGYFSQWWDKFIKWSFFAPIYVFMIYLSLSIFDAQGKFKTGVFPQGNAEWGKAMPGLTTVGMPQAIFQWILVIAMMFGSLIVALKFGVEGATSARKILTGWGTGTKNWAGRKIRDRALGVGAKEAAPGVKARPGLLVRGAQKLAAVPGGKLLADQVFKMTAAQAGTVEDAKKQFANWTPEANQAYSQAGRGTANQQMGVALALKEQGKLDTLGEPRIKELAALASRQYPKQLDEILKVAPHLAKEFNKNIKEIIGKIEKADEVMIESLGHAEVVMNLNPQQLKTIAQKASDQKITILKNTVEREFNVLNRTIRDRIDNNIIGARNKDARNNELRRLEEDERTGAVPVGTAKTARARFTTTSPAWDI